MRISDWSSDVCSSDLGRGRRVEFSRDTPIHHGRRGMTNANGGALLRLAQPELGRLIATVLDAPDPLEGGAFALFGMRETATSMVFTLAELITPEAGEIGWGEGNVRINHPYLRRVAKPERSEEHTSELQ